MGNYIKENDRLILRSRDEIHRILTAFIKSGITIDKEILPQMKYRDLYLEEKLKGVIGEKHNHNAGSTESEQAV